MKNSPVPKYRRIKGITKNQQTAEKLRGIITALGPNIDLAYP